MRSAHYPILRHPRGVQPLKMRVIALGNGTKPGSSQARKHSPFPSLGHDLHRRSFLRFIRLLPHAIVLLFIAHGLGTSSWFFPSIAEKRESVYRTLSETKNSKTNDSEVAGSKPEYRSRFHSPWKMPPPVRFLNLSESRNRILYSPLRRAASDGIGHAFGTMNAEVGAALRLGIAYTHRVAYYGSLTDENPTAVEDFFGWDREIMERSVVRETFCKSPYTGFWLECQTCEALKPNSTYAMPGFENIVSIPINMTYKRITCHAGSSPDQESFCTSMIKAFVRKHSKPNTIFQMPVELCDKSPVDPKVDQRSRAYFFHKYWKKWGMTTLTEKRSIATEVEARSVNVGEAASGSEIADSRYLRFQRISSRFKDAALVIAVHARRGDFFKVKSREMISCATYAMIIREVVDIVKAHGGIFAELPVEVHIYSEGAQQIKTKTIGHDIKQMTKDFYDSDGTVRNESWIEDLIRTPSALVKRTSEGDMFSNGLVVKLHVSEDTLQCLHEMIAADVFIGSESAMGKYVVAALSRGAMQMIPNSASPFEGNCCHVGFRPTLGILNKKRAKNMWKEYAEANEDAIRQAVEASTGL